MEMNGLRNFTILTSQNTAMSLWKNNWHQFYNSYVIDLAQHWFCGTKLLWIDSVYH